MEGEGKEEKGMGGKGRDVAPPMKISAYAPARFHVQIQDTDYVKQRSIDTMTPNKLAIYFVADMVVADSEAVPKSSRGWKWKNLLRRILKDKSQYEGQGFGHNRRNTKRSRCLTRQIGHPSSKQSCGKHGG